MFNAIVDEQFNTKVDTQSHHWRVGLCSNNVFGHLPHLDQQRQHQQQQQQQQQQHDALHHDLQRRHQQHQYQRRALQQRFPQLTIPMSVQTMLLPKHDTTKHLCNAARVNAIAKLTVMTPISWNHDYYKNIHKTATPHGSLNARATSTKYL